jgi:hypothetical protein
MRIHDSHSMLARNGAIVKCYSPLRKVPAFVALAPTLLMTSLLILGFLGRSAAHAQTQGSSSQANSAGSGNPQPVGTMSEIMTSMVYPPANNILLAAYRGGAQDDKEWLAIQRSAVLLAESGNVLMMRGPAGGQSDWAKDAKLLSDVGAAAYKAARAKDANALMGVAQPLNAACTTCHKQYRANIAAPGERVGPSHQPAE